MPLGAALMLACYFVQCCWLITQLPMEADESWRAFPESFHQSAKPESLPDALPRHESPLTSRLARSLPWRRFGLVNPKIVLRLPFAIIGVMLGASIWIITVRWYGSAGGLIAMVLFCFSPPLVAAGSAVSPGLLAVWGFYGSVFLAIATAHSLYATPGSLTWLREWRNPMLFGVALGIGTAAEFWAVLALPFAFAYAIYLVPKRWGVAILRLTVGCALAALILFAVYGFQPASLAAALRDAVVIEPTIPSLLFSILRIWMVFLIPAGALALLALVAWVGSPRVRHFSNTVPLLPALLLPFVLGPNSLSDTLRPLLPSIVLGAMFIGGVMADMMESRIWRILATCLGLASAVAGIQIVTRM